MKRIGLGGSDIGQRARSFTTYAFAFIILGLGFFLAGVPLGAGEQTAEQTPQPQETTSPGDVAEQPIDTPEVGITPTPRLTPETGAFGGPPPELASTESISDSTNITPSISLTATVGPEATLEVESPAATPQPTNTLAPTATPEPTATPTPTETPLPTLTPTPISGETAVIDIGGGNVWLLRSPGGQNLVILSNGATVILLDRRANQGGVLWQEVMTVDGLVGWLQDSYLVRE